jgi:protein TonB
MAREMFEAAAIGARRKGRWYTVPLSIVTHVALVAGFVIVPLVVTEALPLPSSVLVFATPPPPPTPVPPPATPELPRPVTAPATVAPDVAPIVAPPAIVDAPPTVATFVQPASPGALASSAPGVTLAAPPTPAPPAPAGPIPVGGKIRPPAKTYDVVPVYPTIARAAHVQGTVRIEATIGKDGSVRDARVVDSVKMLDEAALAAVRQWRYRPSYLNGEPIEVLMTVSVQFTLQ